MSVDRQTDKKSVFLAGLGKALSLAMQPTMFIEKIPSSSAKLKTEIYNQLSQDNRIEAFDELTNFDSSAVNRDDYIDAVLYAGRFLLANKLINECYFFLTVCQSRVESVYGSPFDYTIYEEIGNMFYLTRNYSEAIKFYERLIELGEQSQAVLHFNIGMCYQEMNNYPLAIQSYLKSINLDTNFIKSFLSLGQCYHSLNQFDKAIGIFQQLPDCAEAFTCIGNSYFSMKNYEEAISFYLRSISLKQDAGVYNNLGAALKKAGFLQDAIFAFNDSLGLENTQEASGNLITLFVETGKIEEAEKVFNNSKKILSASDLKFFQRLIEEKAERMRRASVIMSKAVSIMSKNPSEGVTPKKGSIASTVNKAAGLFIKSVRK